ncbi:MAG: NAD-dependent epimerase/dehydratase family protein [Sulfobacillus thermotolerans]|nr:NAD-dependent epimerase/dehydratase family protein [Sulfobacillus thermotolerans]
MRILVTGGSGFIGHALVARLMAMGMDVVVADLVPSRHPNVQQVVGDLLDRTILEQSLTPGTDAVIHLAGFTSVLKSIPIPYQVYETNLKMTADLLERSRQLGVKNFVFASSNAVVGNVGSRLINEDMPLQPLTPYGATKAASEMLISAYTASYGIYGCAVRLTNVYGTGMMHKDSMIPRLMRAALGQSPVHIYGDGEQVRDYIYLGDVVEVFVNALTKNITGPLTTGFGRSVSVNTLCELASEAVGRPIEVDHIAAMPGEMPAVIVNTARLKSLGMAPQVDLPEGLKAVWEDFQTFS